MITAAEQKERLVREAEQLAATSDFRAGHLRAQELRKAFDALPSAGAAEREYRRRFREALDRFYERRRADGARRAAAREEARRRKEALVREAQQVATWTDTRAAAQQMQRLFEQWRAAGSAGREHEDRLWRAFNDARNALRARGQVSRAAGQREWAARRVQNLRMAVDRADAEVRQLDYEINQIADFVRYGSYQVGERHRKREPALRAQRDKKVAKAISLREALQQAEDELRRLG